MSTTDTTCTCPSGDGSLRWPCPTHPPTERDERLRDARVWVSVAHDRLDDAHSPSSAASEIDVALVVLDAEVARLDAVVTAVRDLVAELEATGDYGPYALLRRALDGGAA